MIMLFNMMKRRTIQSLSGNGTVLPKIVFFSLRLKGFLSGYNEGRLPALSLIEKEQHPQKTILNNI
jgi:hypothetical protein